MLLYTAQAQPRPWQVVVSPLLAETALTTARSVAEHLRNDTCFATAARLAAQQSQYPFLFQDVSFKTFGGNAGLALLFAALDGCFPEEGWDRAGHQHLLIVARALEASYSHHCGLSLSAGLSGVAFATWLSSRNGKRYQKLLTSIEHKLWSAATASAEKIVAQHIHGCSEGTYDVISGLAGVGAYVLCRLATPAALSTLRAILTSLIYLTEEEDGIFHWYIPPHLITEKDRQLSYPDGYYNCGLAHGIPGPLALLSLARHHGIEVPGLDSAIERIADWLIARHEENEWGIDWPAMYPVKGCEPDTEFARTSRCAWCYGTPGVARALWLAGEALNRSAYRQVALAGMQAVYRRPIMARKIDSAGICHGIAGLLQITLRFAHDTGDPLFSGAACALSQQLLDLYQPDALLGYRYQESAEVFVDHPWLLDGAAGVTLVLLAASTSNQPTWDRLFLLS